VTTPAACPVDTIRQKLNEFFAPSDVLWRYGIPKDPKAGDRFPATPYLSPVAVQQRFDDAVGFSRWNVEYDIAPTGEVWCSIVCVLGKRTVRKVAIAAGRDDPQKSLVAAHAAAFLACAAAYGIGRYLPLMPRQWVEWDGKGVKAEPTVPQIFLPHSHRRAGQPTGDRIAQLVAVACEREKRDAKATVYAIMTEYGYTADDSAATAGALFARLENRHANDVLQRVNEWVKAIAAGDLNSPVSPWHNRGAAPQVAPLPEPEAKPEEPNPEALALAFRPPTATAKPAPEPAPEVKNPPKDGAELLMRLSAFDEKLAGEKLCVKGAVLNHVLKEGEKHKHPADLVGWNSEAVRRGVQWATEYEKVLRAQVRPDAKVPAKG
jgi:hypothetical protein